MSFGTIVLYGFFVVIFAFGAYLTWLSTQPRYTSKSLRAVAITMSFLAVITGALFPPYHGTQVWSVLLGLLLISVIISSLRGLFVAFLGTLQPQNE